MNKLIKAEGFRLRRQITFLLVCTVIYGLIPAVTSINAWEANLGTQLEGSGITVMSLMMLFPPIFASITGNLYDHGKLGYYEIMAGNKTFGIVFSKLATDGALFLVLTAVATCAYYVFAGIRNGFGGFDHALIRLLLILLVLAHLVFCCVLITLCVRQVRTGAVACFMRFWIIDILFFPFLMWLAGTVMDLKQLALHFSYMSLTNQLMILVSEPLDAMIVLHVLLGFAAEFALWYVIIDLGIRKRKIA